ncbi:phosphatases II [Ascobolus immersus RN42]|uniref:phosphatidylinositol-3,4,5-trisphosphate 3-phosphatase n=1 Tax=Ascobolus immersus RN42 TaxID=1160509 RepID=A0A3N4IV17_ASCIM|nr:phosphatases II [Ascobolus immersus RN42]
MAAFLRSLVAGPRKPHSETGLDLCYVHETNPCIVVMSVPSSTYPKKAYRNDLTDVVAYLDKAHGDRWSVWEFRAEGTGYEDSEVHNRIYHAPWPDHQPPPFEHVPNVMATMRDHLRGGDKDKEGGERVAVLHCKAGKGRSGTMACAYLIAEERWDPKDALARFTEARMRPGFGEGVSIKSQLRWIEYIYKWAKELDKTYVDSEIEIIEVRIWGLRENTKILVDGYKEKGRILHTFHTFTNDEVIDMPEDTPGYLSPDFPHRKRSSRLSLRSSSRSKRSTSSARPSSSDLASPTNLASPSTTTTTTTADVVTSPVAPTETTTDTTNIPTGAPVTEAPPTLITRPTDPTDTPGTPSSIPGSGTSTPTSSSPTYPNVICRPSQPLIIPNSDASISFSSSTPLPLSLSLVTSIAYFWFNAYFHPTGTVSLTWEELDGLKGTYRKGFRALDRVEVVFRRVPGHEHVVKEAPVGESHWEEQPGKAEEGVGEQGVGEKGDWIRTKETMERQGLAQAEAISPIEHGLGKQLGHGHGSGGHEVKLGGEKDVDTKKEEKKDEEKAQKTVQETSS